MIKISDYKSGDEKQIIELFNIVFNKEMTLEFWNWRFNNNPFGNHLIKLIWDDEKLVGHYAVASNEIIINDKKYKSALSMSTMVHPDYNGRGYFSDLAKELYSNFSSKQMLDFVYGFPNLNSHYGFITKLKWKDVSLLPTYSLIINGIGKSDIQFNKVDRFTNKHEKLLKDTLGNYDIYLNKNEIWLNWRYFGNPLNEYLVLEIENSFVVGKYYMYSNQIEFDICEMVISSYDNFVSLVNSIINYKKDLNIKKINIWLNKNDDRLAYAEKIGFTPNSPITYLGCLSLNNEIINPHIKSFSVSMGDSDIF